MDKNKWTTQPIEEKKPFELPGKEGELAIDVYQTDKEIVIQTAVSGVTPEELDISMEKDVLTIRGSRENPSEDKNKKYLFQECYWGKFVRRIIIPEETDPSRINASMKDGVITIRIPRIIREKKSSIVVQKC